MAPTPVNVVTGALGAGKTTTILSLLRHKPADQRWAVLVNEAGVVGVDGAMLEGLAAGEGMKDGVVIREVPGGCMCCVAGLPSQLALVELLRRAKPDRLLVEPTGLGHPAAILDQIRALGDTVELRATVTLVDPRNLSDERFLAHQTFEDQAQLADVLVATHDDVNDDATRARFDAWASGFFPAKSGVLHVAEGALDPAWLDAPRAARVAKHPEAHRHDHDREDGHDHEVGHDHDSDHDSDHGHGHGHGHGQGQAEHGHGHGSHEGEVPEALPEPTRDAPLRFVSAGLGHVTCGFLFHRDVAFDEEKLVALFRRAGLPSRVKGVLRVASGPASGDVPYLAFNRSREGLHVRPVAYRGESRIELIARDDEPHPWDEVERALRDAEH
ncbi:MAG: GTP-binding protein [Polyangiales bacterium]